MPGAPKPAVAAPSEATPAAAARAGAEPAGDTPAGAPLATDASQEYPSPAAPPPPRSTSCGVERPPVGLEEQVWQELRQLYNPEIPVNIVELGLIYAMRTAPLPDGGNRVEVLMTVTSPACGMSEMLRTEADARLRGLAGVREVEVAITFEPPWTPELMSEEARLLLNF